MIREDSAIGLILMTGNGHIQKDIGVFRCLSNTECSRSEVIGFTEGYGVTDNETEAWLYD